MKKSEARQFRDALRRLIVAHGVFEEAKRPCGTPLSMPHAHALLELLQDDESMMVTTLATKLAIDRTNVSRLCARMESAGDVIRDTHPEDGRAVVLRLTKKGKELAKTVDERSAQHFAQLAKTLGPASTQVVESLQLLTQAMHQTPKTNPKDRP